MLSFPILQSDPALDKAVDQLTKSSLEIAQAASDYGALKVIFGIFMVFMILLIILFVYQVFTMNSKINTIYQAAIKSANYFENLADCTIGKEQANIILRRNFNYLTQIIKYYILRIRLENHIDDKAKTQTKVTQIIRNEFTELQSFLGNFLIDDIPLSDVLNLDDTKIIEDFMMEQIYIDKEAFSVSNMDQSVNIFLNGIKLEYIKKLDSNY